MKKFFFWGFIAIFLLASIFLGMVFYGKYQISQNFINEKYSCSFHSFQFRELSFFETGTKYHVTTQLSYIVFLYSVDNSDYSHEFKKPDIVWGREAFLESFACWSPISGLSYIKRYIER